MSTNYYAFGPFSGGEASGEGLHIGQHAGGWEFLWRAHDERGLICTDTWLSFLSKRSVTIQTEAGTVVRLDDFWKHATLRPANVSLYTMNSRPKSSFAWRDRLGCPFSAKDFC